MTIRGPRVQRPLAFPAVAIILALASAACAETIPSPSPSPSPRPTVAPTAVATPSPSPTPPPTPRFTNAADPELAAVFPATVEGIPLVVPPLEEFALTPGDVGLAYGELGARFESLAIAYLDQPRLTLYAVRVDGDPVATKDLERYLAAAGRYVGIAGLHPEPWELADVAGYRVWTRPGDRATAAGTRIYTWSSGEFVFLLIGADDSVNRALIGALPGEPASPAEASPSP